MHRKAFYWKSPRSCARAAGFTLLELLLVIVILGVATAIVMPAFSHAVRGSRIRLASRTLAMAGRYARSLAVLQQRDLTLDIHLTNATLRVAGRDDRIPFLEQTLDGVTVESLELVLENRILKDGMARILYRSNGTCTPYIVRLTDDEGRHVTLRVDALSAVETEGP